MNNDKRIIDIICDNLLPLAFLFLVVICIIIFFTLPVHAASDQDYFPMSQNKNNHFTSSVISGIESQFDSVNNNIFSYWVRTQAQWNVVNVAYYPKSDDLALYGEKNNDLIHFSLYQYGSGGFQYRQIFIDNNGNIGGIYNAGIGDFQNLVSSNYSSSVDYVSNFQMYTNNSNTKKIVLLYDDGVTIPDDNTARDDTEKPNIENYIPTDTAPPSFDDSSVEAALGSIFDYLQFETNKISGTITGIGKYLSDSLMWGLQMVINNIRSKIQEMITAIGDKIDEVKVGIGSIIDNIEDFVDYIKEPVDKQAIETALEGTTLYSVSNIGSSIKNIFSDYFDSIPQPDTLVFTIPYTILTKSGYITVDFSWYAGIRSSVLPWVVGFLYAGFALSIFRSIPSIIHGVSGVLQKGG